MFLAEVNGNRIYPFPAKRKENLNRLDPVALIGEHTRNSGTFEVLSPSYLRTHTLGTQSPQYQSLWRCKSWNSSYDQPSLTFSYNGDASQAREVTKLGASCAGILEIGDYSDGDRAVVMELVGTQSAWNYDEVINTASYLGTTDVIDPLSQWGSTFGPEILNSSTTFCGDSFRVSPQSSTSAYYRNFNAYVSVTVSFTITNADLSGNDSALNPYDRPRVYVPFYKNTNGVYTRTEYTTNKLSASGSIRFPDPNNSYDNRWEYKSKYMASTNTTYVIMSGSACIQVAPSQASTDPYYGVRFFTPVITFPLTYTPIDPTINSILCIHDQIMVVEGYTYT